MFPGPGQITSISSLNFQVYDGGETAPGTKYAASPGGFNVYLIPDTTSTTPDSSLVFNSDPTGLVGQGNVGSSTLLGTIDFSTPPATAGYLPFTPNASVPTSTLTTLINDLNSGTPFRVALTPNTSTTAADSLEGDVNGSISPSLTITGDGTPTEQLASAHPAIPSTKPRAKLISR